MTAHNRVLRAAEKRARELEPKLAALLEPILVEAGDVAAANFERFAVDHINAAAARDADMARVARMAPAEARALVASLALTAAVDVQANSTMVCVKPRPEQAVEIHDDDGYPPENLHCTLVYLGEIDGPLTAVVDALRAVAAAHAPLAGVVGGYGQFGTPGGPVGVLLPDVPGLVELRVAVTDALVAADIDYSRDHGFAAHLTVDPDAEPDELEKMLPLAGSPLNFDELLVVRGDVEVVPLPLVGVPPVTASLTAAARPGFCLPAALRTATDPVRLAVIETVARSTVEGAGLAFDVTNPFFDKVVKDAGRQVTHIARTTQLDVMKAVKASYEAGLSIRDTATAIQTVMRDTATTRATLIARTELAGAVNGASLAAMNVVASALPDGAYEKEWLTAPGAQFPRHELYEGLDGQTAGLQEPFDVGGEALMFPGDPAGDPSEVCNCRCLAPESVVSGAMLSASRRVFEGDLVRLVTASGREATVTPNHPILTRHGWVNAGHVNKGDDLVCRLRFDSASGSPDVDDVPTTAEQRFAALELAAARRERVSAGTVDFHGEIAEGEVDVVWACDGLSREGEPALIEHLRQLTLALSHREMGLDGDGSALIGVQETEPVRLARPARLNAMSGEYQRHGATSDTVSLAESESAFAVGVATDYFGSNSSVPLVEARALRVAKRPSYAAVTQVFPDCHDSEASLVGDLLVAHPRLVELDPVVHFSRRRYVGHVYNFSTISGTFPIDGIVSANCAMSYADQGGREVGDQVESVEASAYPCEAHAGVSDVAAELDAVVASLTAALSATWSAPAPSEILNVNCDVHQTPAPSVHDQHVLGQSGYDAKLLPKWARTPVHELTPEAAKAEMKKLQWTRNRLNHTLRNTPADDARMARLRAKVEAANARLDELKARASGVVA